MSKLCIHLLGRFRAQCNEQGVAGLEGCKVQELLCYLLLYRDRPHHRQKLAGLLWGDSTDAQARRYLRQTLWHLQTALDAQRDPVDQGILRTDSFWIYLNTEAPLWLDVAVFEQAFVLGRDISGQELDARRAQALQYAIDLYQGDLLEGWYHEWCLYERERLQQMYLAMLDKLMGYCEAQHAYESGLLYGMQILRLDPARERTHRRLMRLQYLAGDRTAALRQYDCCVAVLREEFGVEPRARTVRLYEQIRADQLGGEFKSPMAVRATAATTGSLPEVQGRLRHLRSALTEIQRQATQDIEIIDHLLSGQR